MLYGKLHDLFDDDNVPWAIEKELEEAFKGYVQAYATKKIRFLKKYFSRECILSLSPSIMNENRFFPTKEFYEVIWHMVSREGDIVTIEHTLDYKEIKSKGVSIEVSQDYKEIWKFNVANNMVESVTR